MRYIDFVKTLPCLVFEDFGFECQGPIHPHHVRSRGAGGIDEGNLIPLCANHHQLVHKTGRLTFQKNYHTNFKLLAHDIYYDYTLRMP